MLKQFLVLMGMLLLLPTAAKAQNGGAVAGLAFYAGIMTAGCALFVVSAKSAEEVEAEYEPEESGVDYSRRGFYVDGGISYGYGFSGHMGGVRADFGYRCHPRFAVDLEYEGFYLRGSEGFEGSILTTGEFAGFSDSADNYWNIVYNGKAFLSTGRVQPFLLIGFGFGSTDRKRSGTSNTDFMMNVGAGVDYWLTESLALSFDMKYKALTKGTADLGHISLGTKLKFMF